jgi:hypothetical protein
MNAWCKRNRAEKQRKKQHNREKKKTQKKKNRRVSNFTPLTEKEEEKRAVKKT